MFISKKCHYALRAVFELAIRKDSGPVKVHDIADTQGIPERFLEVILNQLKHGGFVVSYRGQDGGYALARPADQINVGQIVSFVQGLPEPTNNLSKKQAGQTRGDYALESLWRKVSDSINKTLTSTTISDLLEMEAANGLESLIYAI